MADLKRTEMSVRREQAVLVGVILPDSTADPRDPLGELSSLAKTAGAKVVARLIQRRQRPDAGTFCGSGKAIEIAHLAMKHDADVVLFDNDLTPAQIGALEKLINKEAKKPLGEGIKVLDRSELILDIFATRAQTHEARLQVELAQLRYVLPRLSEKHTAMSRLTGIRLEETGGRARARPSRPGRRALPARRGPRRRSRARGAAGRCSSAAPARNGERTARAAWPTPRPR